MDLLGTPLYLFAKRLTTEVLTVRRAGTLIEWNDEGQRAFLASYQAEQIINWRMTRLGGRNELALVVLRETAEDAESVENYFEAEALECGGSTPLRLPFSFSLSPLAFSLSCTEYAARAGTPTNGTPAPEKMTSTKKSGATPVNCVDLR